MKWVTVSEGKAILICPIYSDGGEGLKMLTSFINQRETAIIRSATRIFFGSNMYTFGQTVNIRLCENMMHRKGK